MGAITDAASKSINEGVKAFKKPKYQDVYDTIKDPQASRKRSLAYNLFNPEKKPEDGGQGADPQLEAIITKQAEAANKYREGLAATKQKMGDVGESAINADTARGLKDVDKNASARGLLYSGIPQGQKANIIGTGASDIAKSRLAANTAAENEANRLDAVASGQAYSQSDLDQNAQSAAFNTALARDQSNFQTAGSLGDSLGRSLARYQNSGNTNKQIVSPNNQGTNSNASYGTTNYNGLLA